MNVYYVYSIAQENRKSVQSLLKRHSAFLHTRILTLMKMFGYRNFKIETDHTFDGK